MLTNYFKVSFDQLKIWWNDHWDLLCPSFADCGYRKISDPLDSKLKPQKCTDDGLNPAGPYLKQLNNKKHFIIHTPEHDKVGLIGSVVYLIILAVLY